MRTLGAHAKASAACVLLAAAGLAPAHAALPPNTAITNTATVTFRVSGVPIAVSGTHTVVTSTTTPAAIELLLHPGSGHGAAGSTRTLSETSCAMTGGGWDALAPPVVPGVGRLLVPGEQLLTVTTAYASGDAVIVQVTDYDQNRDPAARDTLVVTVSTSGGDRERLRLTESGLSTGVFLGYIQTSASPAQPGNCVLNIGGNQKITATYIDSSEDNVAVSVAALVDPLGVLFDSSSGAPVNGARITLLDTATGQPAVVFGNDGVSAFPATVVTGGSVTDGGGASYNFAPGRYQFPRVAPGSYRFQVELPPGYRFPSKVADAALQALPNGPYFIVPGSRGEVFTVVPGPPLEIDLPVDPGPLGDLDIIKSSGKAVAAIGDFVPYTLSVASRNDYPLADVRIADRLPVGFRYQPGSARLDDKPLADPQVTPDGRGLQFALGALAPKAAVSLRYVAAIGAGARTGLAENTAQAAGRITSNIARATLMVRDELNRSRAILIGRVMVAQSCDQDARLPGAVQGLKGVRIMLQDGTAIITDAEGNWHADNLRPGTHVVQVDATTLPQDMELRNCDQTSRTGGRDLSQFVNLQGGSLWRADFRLVRRQSCVNQQLLRRDGGAELRLGSAVANHGVTATMLLPAGAKVAAGSVLVNGKPHPGVQVDDGFVVLRLPAQAARWEQSLALKLEAAQAGELKAAVRVQAAGGASAALQPLVLKAGDGRAEQCAPLVFAATPAAAGTAPASAAPAEVAAISLVEKLPYDDKWLAAAAPGNDWLHPRAGFNPALPAVKVAIKHARGTQVEVKVGGVAVDPLRFEGTMLSPNGEWALSNWRAVDLRDGANQMEVTVRDAGGAVLLQESRSIHYAVAPASASFEPGRSVLAADGRTPPVIAVRMVDRNGQPARRGVGGDFTVAAPYLPQQRLDAIQQEPLAGNIGGRPRFQVGDDGVALITLQPTTQSGEVVLRFDFGDNRPHEVRAWLQADLRDWVLVGFAEGTLGHKRLSGNLDGLDGSGAGEQLFDQNRLAFFAKGRIKGDFLLTMAYDSAKQRGTNAERVLRQAVDPNQYYTLYADATQPQYDAASTSKLYLRIEKKQFYALFGDFDTGLTVTELGRYSRTLTGLKSEYKGETFSYNAFAARTSQSFLKDELQGDGTSGLYRLRGRRLLVNSEKVRIELRDRFQPDRVLNTRGLTPFLDYQIDHEQGTLFFREPVPSRDQELNLVFIVVEYETDDRDAAALTLGGRVAMKVAPGAEVGLTHLREGNTGREARLTAADAKVQLGEATRLRAEVATSQSNTAAGPRSGQAYLVEATHDDGKLAARAYVSAQQPGFGLGQQAAAATGQRKVGADARYQLSDQLQLQGEAYRQDDLSGGARREVVEGRAQWADKEGLTVSAGARVATETDSAGVESQARQLTGGVAYEMMDRKLVLRASTDLDVGSQGTVNFPNRLVLGIDYRVTPETTLFATQEFARGETISANTTRVGLRSRLWAGAEVQVGAGSQQSLDAGRLYASMGLVQKIKIDEHWSADAGIDRVHTLKSASNPLGPAQPPASGLPPTGDYGILTGDYTAVSLGLAYNDEWWSGNARAEWRGGETDTKVNLLLGAQRKLGQGRVVALGLALISARAAAADSRQLSARLSYAQRPNDSNWSWLQRLEYVEDASQSLATRLFTRKLIANSNVNWKAGPRTQVAFQYSAKYVREMLGDTSHSGYTDLFGAEARHDLSEKWDVGLHAGMLTHWSSGTRSYHLGLSVGYRLADNTWVSVGYNHLGFKDGDFTGADHRAQGFYLNLRMKFDQDTFDLNDRKGSTLAKP